MSQRSVVLCMPDDTSFFDPGPEHTEKRHVELVDRWDEHTVGVVGWSSGGWDALALATEHHDLPRLAIVSTPFPDDDDSDHPAVELDAVSAKTLLLFGSKDPQTGSAHGKAWQKSLANSRLEMVPGGDHKILTQMWGRVLSHLAPRQKQ